MAEKEIFQKMIDEAMAAQRADIEVIKEKRGGEFVISDALPYVNAVKGMKAGPGQSPEVISLHVDSVVAHFEILRDLTKTIRPEDDPYVEHYQTPPVYEILLEEDPNFKEAVDKFIDQLKKERALIQREAIRRYGGWYGPIASVSFATEPGGTASVVNKILLKTDIDPIYKQTILAAKSWGMLTSYGFGAAFIDAIKAGKTAEEATEEEIKTLEKVYTTPVEAQAELMDAAGMISFDCREYMKRYKERMRGTVKKALDAGVNPANIVVVPAYCVGDVGHHISQSMFNTAKDDVVMAVMEATTDSLENTLRAGLREGVYKSEWDVLRASRCTGAPVAYMLEKDGFTVPMIVDLLVKRFYHYTQYPEKTLVGELHNVDFLDMLVRGWHILRNKGEVIPGLKVDLSPVDANEVLKNPQRYAYPGCAITVRLSALMRLADFPCLLTSEPVTATLCTNIVALHPKDPIAPVKIYKLPLHEEIFSTVLLGLRKQEWAKYI